MHKLSGPFRVEGAKPGDLLIVDILDVGPIPQEDSGPLAGQGWGYTGIFAKSNGGGFLTDVFPDAYKAIWDFQRADRDIASHSRGFVRRIDPSWSDGDGAIGRVVGPLELT